MSRVFYVDACNMSPKELKEVHEHKLEWITHDNGWAATYYKPNTVPCILHVIDKREYFKLKLDGRDASALVKYYDEWCKSNKIGLYESKAQ